MKKDIATLPLIEAFRAGDECPFCYLERAAEQHAISFILGSAYMEDYIREKTDEMGFCRHHYKMMYDYGNRLGSALILSTHLKKLNEELAQALQGFTPGKSGIFKRMKRTQAIHTQAKTPLGAWLDQKKAPATSAATLTRSTPAIWIPFLTCTVKTVNFVTRLQAARAFACRISAIWSNARKTAYQTRKKTIFIQKHPH